MNVTRDQFTAHVDDLLNQVEQGLEVILYKDERAVVTIRPAEGLVFANLADPARPLRDIDLGPPPKRREIDALYYLMKDREKDRT